MTWLQRVDGHCRELGLVGRTHAWHSSRIDPGASAKPWPPRRPTSSFAPAHSSLVDYYDFTFIRLCYYFILDIHNFKTITLHLAATGKQNVTLPVVS